MKTLIVILLTIAQLITGKPNTNTIDNSTCSRLRQVDLSDIADRRCGNGVCQLGESCVTCVDDCGTCPPLVNARIAVNATQRLRTAVFDDASLSNRRRLNQALQCGAPDFAESACYRSVTAVQHGPESALPSGTLNYAVFTKQKNNGPRKGDGNQAALFLKLKNSGNSVWFGVREPLCDARMKSTKPTQERATDEFGVMMLIAYAIDVLLDAGFVPTTALVELDVDAHEAAALATSSSAADTALPIICAFEEFGAVNVLEQQRSGHLPRKLLGVVQSTRAAESKGDPTRGVRLIHDTSKTLFSLIVEFSVQTGMSEHENGLKDTLVLARQLARSTRLGRACTTDRRRNEANSECNTAFRLLLFAFLAGVPLREQLTAIINLHPDDRGAMIPLLVGDVDRAGEFLRCRERLPNAPELFAPGGDKSNPLFRIDTSWMRPLLHVMLQYDAIHTAPLDRLAQIDAEQSTLVGRVEEFLRHNLSEWSSAVVDDDVCMIAAGVRGTDKDVFFRDCANQRAEFILKAFRNRTPIKEL
jgi:hypothetical protein